MKNKILKTFLLLTLTAAIGLVACKTAQPVTNPDGTNTTVKVFDPFKTERVKRRVGNLVKPGIHYLLSKNKTHAAEIAAYIGDARNIFCKAVETKTFSHEFLIAEADKLGTPELVKALRESGDDDLAVFVMAGKDEIIGLFEELIGDAGTVDLNPEGWPYQVASLFCENFTTALHDEGY
jgi:hypothetical protein